ncbi:MAG TPA: hypothetical protein VN417_04180 [Candidatus Cryosericum sp.]|nr:hypothetical protein [Candidatus Cryosericum sp.]
MVNRFENEIRFSLAEAACGAYSFRFDASRLHLPARHAAASLRLPNGTPDSPAQAISARLYGVELIESCRVVNGWLLFELSRAFYDALTEQVNAELPPPASDLGRHALNRMLVLARHEGTGCPNIAALQRALLLCVCAGKSPASLLRAERATRTLFHSIEPNQRPALLNASGALGNACARLLFDAAAEPAHGS